MWQVGCAQDEGAESEAHVTSDEELEPSPRREANNEGKERPEANNEGKEWTEANYEHKDASKASCADQQEAPEACEVKPAASLDLKGILVHFRMRRSMRVV